MAGVTAATLGPAILVSVKATGLAVAQIVLTCLAGYVLGRIGFLDKKAQKFLNNMNMLLFTPALIFSKIALSLTPEKLVSIAVVPIGFVLFTAVSAGIAWIMSRVFKLSIKKQRLVICCSMAVNSNSLPIALIQGLSANVPALRATPNDTPNEMLARGISYLVLYSTLGLVWRWSFMVSYLEKSDEPTRLDLEQAKATSTTLHSSEEGHSIEKPDDAEDPARSAGSLPNAKPQTVEQPPAIAERPPRWRHWLRTISQFVTPPTYAAIVSIFIAAITPIQHVVARATPITGAIDSLAEIAVPLTLVVLGAYFYTPPEKRQSETASSDSSSELAPVSPKDPEANRAVIAAVISRMILTPVILYPFLLTLSVFTPFKIFHDPIFLLAGCLLIGGPTAVTMAQLTSAASATFELLVSRIIFWSYIVLLTPLTIVGTLVAILITMIPPRA
ncbi:hypothetical protein AURDEDRAFT_156172 [Auricularia subglabra TFB-10046 SS5]|nr:hypothetical protein AURDEDRAFT_156172 [Auricularia subglabra TFB-10046 SS5]